MNNLQIKFIQLLEDYGYDVFNLDMVKDWNLFTVPEIHRIIRLFTKEGLLIRLERNKFVRNRFVDDHVVANFLAPDGGIAYWTALNTHGLTEQFANRIFVQTAMRKKDISKGSRQYKFVKVHENKLFGYKTYGIG